MGLSHRRPRIGSKKGYCIPFMPSMPLGVVDGIFLILITLGTPDMQVTCPKGNFETMVGFVSVAQIASTL